MPSQLIGVISGGQNLLSGNYFSGLGAFHPVGGLQLRADKSNSGNIYVALSGGVTINSGVISNAGVTSGGFMDGFPLAPGDSYFIPKIAFIQSSGGGLSGTTGSGTPGIFVACDSACSGTARVNYEAF